jgi:hypothetical protein
MSGLRDGLVNTCCGALLVWVAARSATHGTVLGPLATGWLGMIGLVMFLHFGVFHLLALMWRRAGVPVRPLMSTPLAAASLSDFWSRRWNTAFSALAQTLAFRPLANLLFRAFQSRQAALAGATLVVFFISGVVHELVISVPAGAGYGLPTAYFVLQAAGVLAERSRWGRCAGLGRGLRGWLWVAGFTAGPAYFLFHPPFVFNVILPMLRAIAAI